MQRASSQPANRGRKQALLLLEIYLFFGVWHVGCEVSACPQPPYVPQPLSNAVVRDDTALLAAVKNQSVDSILLDNDITLGSAWASVSPVKISRNLTIYSEKIVTWDLSVYQNLMYLGSDVVLQIRALQLQGRFSLMQPSVSLIGGAGGNASLYLNFVQMLEICCLPPDMWSRYTEDYELADALFTIDTTFVCDKANNCFDQEVTFIEMCSQSDTSPAAAPFRDYQVYWSHVVMLCEQSADPQCLAQKATQPCIAECAALGHRPRFPPAPAPPPMEEPSINNMSSSTSGHTEIIRTIILATVIPFVVVVGILTAIALFLWHNRVPRRPGTDAKQSGKQEELCSSGGPHDLEEGGSSPILEPMAGSQAAAPSMGLGDSQSATGTCSSTERSQPGPTDPAGSQAMSMGTEGMHSEALNTPQTAGIADTQLCMDLPNELRSVGTVASSQARSAHRGAGRFDAAAAVAKIAGNSSGDDAIDTEMMDLQRRVQLLAEGRLISEDEKLVLGKPIGRGAFGMVFRGLWRNLDVAVKTMLFSQNDGSRQENAIVEAALASSVVHPNVVSVYHYDMKPIEVKPEARGNPDTLHIEHQNGQMDWKMYIVQELCQTSLVETLETWVFHDHLTGLPRMDLILSVLLDVASGCAHIHSKNIIWGDLKPGNVLLKMDASKPHGIIAKITDFGMSTTIDPNLSHISNYNKGTPFYVAPEILISHQATKTSDVFSFGILIQQMITRSTPYQHNKTGGIEVNKLFWRPTLGAPPALAELRRRCLDQNPKGRPSFDEIAKSLQEIYDAFVSDMASSSESAVAHLATRIQLQQRSQQTNLSSKSLPPGQGEVNTEVSTAAASSTRSHCQGEPVKQPPGSIVAQPVPRETRSTLQLMRTSAALDSVTMKSSSVSGAIEDLVSGLQTLETQAPLFVNWPMSDGALQLLEQQHQEPSECRRCSRSNSNVSGEQQLRAKHQCAEPHSEDYFPYWSTQF